MQLRGRQRGVVVVLGRGGPPGRPAAGPPHPQPPVLDPLVDGMEHGATAGQLRDGRTALSGRGPLPDLAHRYWPAPGKYPLLSLAAPHRNRPGDVTTPPPPPPSAVRVRRGGKD